MSTIKQWTGRNPHVTSLWIGIVFLLLAVAFLVNPVRLALNGKAAEGTVTEVTKRTTRDKEGNEKTELTATIRFKAGDRAITKRHSWTERRFSFCFSDCNFRQGDKVRMRYLPNAPETAKIASFGGMWGAPLAAGLIGVIGLVTWAVRRPTLPPPG